MRKNSSGLNSYSPSLPGPAAWRSFTRARRVAQLYACPPREAESLCGLLHFSL